MTKVLTSIAAIFLVTLLAWTPLGVASENVVPYIDLKQPIDGQTVESITTRRFNIVPLKLLRINKRTNKRNRRLSHSYK